MGLFEHLSRVVRANLNPVMHPVTEPAVQLEQMIEQMQADLSQLRQTVAHAIATLKRCERQQVQADQQAEEWQWQAQQALHQGQESQARAALTHRRAYLEMSRSLAVQVQQQRAVLTRLKQSLTTLDIKLTEARTRKDLLIARSHAAAASEALMTIPDAEPLSHRIDDP